MEISNTYAPLVLSAVKDAILYHENLLTSQTINDKTDYEDHHLQLTQLLEYLKEEYIKIETEAGVPLDQLF